MQRHDTDTTKALSNELAEVRKVSRTLGQAKMAFEQVSMRLSTIHDMGNVMVALGPAIASIKSLKPGLGSSCQVPIVRSTPCRHCSTAS